MLSTRLMWLLSSMYPPTTDQLLSQLPPTPISPADSTLESNKLPTSITPEATDMSVKGSWTLVCGAQYRGSGRIG